MFLSFLNFSHIGPSQSHPPPPPPPLSHTHVYTHFLSLERAGTLSFLSSYGINVHLFSLTLSIYICSYHTCAFCLEKIINLTLFFLLTSYLYIYIDRNIRWYDAYIYLYCVYIDILMCIYICWFMIGWKCIMRVGNPSWTQWTHNTQFVDRPKTITKIKVHTHTHTQSNDGKGS